MGGTCGTHGKKDNAKTIDREPEVNKLLGRLRRRWEGSVEGTV